MRSFDRALRMLECRARAFPHAARYGARVRVDGRTADRDPRELERSGLDGFRTWDWDRLLRHSYVVFTLVTAAVIAAGSSYSPSGLDGRAYWLSDLEHLYTRGPGNDLAFLYSPAFAQLVAPFTGLPWSIFLAALTTASLAALWYLLGPWALPALFLFPVSLELLGANINLLLAAAIVAGFRHPWAWSLVLLTKVTPGIGLVWFAVRREWGSLAIAFGWTTAIVAASALVAPQLWAEWFEFLLTTARESPRGPIQPFPVPLIWRLPVAAAVVVYGALTDRPQTVPVAAAIAQPVIWGWTIALGAVPLVDWRQITDRTRRRLGSAGATTPTVGS